MKTFIFVLAGIVIFLIGLSVLDNMENMKTFIFVLAGVVIFLIGLSVLGKVYCGKATNRKELFGLTIAAMIAVIIVIIAYKL